MLVSKDNFEKLSCVEAFISMVAFGGGTHSWTLPISFFGIYAVQKDNRNMMFPSIIFHLFGILLDILVLIFGVGTFAAVFMVINIILKLVLSVVWYKLYTGAEGSNLEVPFQGANLPVAKPWDPATANKSTHTQNAQPTSNNTPYNAPDAQQTDL